MVADDHAIFRQSLIQLLKECPGLEVVGDARDGEQAVDLATLLHPDVIIMDVDMPRMNGIEATRRIIRILPAVRIIGLSMYTRVEMAARMRAAGAFTYFPKDSPVENLLAAIVCQDRSEAG
jgi:DNA-binding NarL/FixJ family response regulator